MKGSKEDEVKQEKWFLRHVQPSEWDEKYLIIDLFDFGAYLLPTVQSDCNNATC